MNDDDVILTSVLLLLLRVLVMKDGVHDWTTFRKMVQVATIMIVVIVDCVDLALTNFIF
jgi:hypothetical protein